MERTIRQLLLNSIERVYFNDAPRNAIFPYVVFDFDSTIYQGPIDLVSLNVHIWDRSQSIKTILLLEKKIRKDLDLYNLS